MNEDIKEKLDLNPNNMNEIAKQAYYQLENYIFNLEKTQNNWNELKNILKNIEEIIEDSLSNVGRNEDCFEYYLGDVDCERILEMIPNFEELEQGKDE